MLNGFEFLLFLCRGLHWKLETPVTTWYSIEQNKIKSNQIMTMITIVAALKVIDSEDKRNNKLHFHCFFLLIFAPCIAQSRWSEKVLAPKTANCSIPDACRKQSWNCLPSSSFQPFDFQHLGGGKGRFNVSIFLQVFAILLDNHKISFNGTISYLR